MRILVYIALLAIPLSTVGQQFDFQSLELNHGLERQRRSKADSVHTAFKPLHPLDRQQVKADQPGDDIQGDGLYNWLNNDQAFKVFPLLDLETGYDLSGANNKFILNEAVGAGMLWKPSDRWIINGNYLFGYWQSEDYMRTVQDSMAIVPGMGYARALGNNYMTHLASGSVNFTPNNHFSFELGRNKHFVGNGYRSLMFSDNSNVYPYFKIDTKIWRVRYTNLYTWLLDIYDANGTIADYKNKFMTTHFLDWNITKSWSMGIFESIVWQGRDTLLNRGYEINYLNPVIFYRPVEYAQGSADNAIMGLNTNVKIHDNHHLYGQFVIDEFLLSAIQQDIKHVFKPNDTTLLYGWWANKYAVQLGYKWFNVAGLENLDLQFEFNAIRPFTFSHGSITQNYGHFNQPLAHPKGANFTEVVNFIRYKKDRFKITNQFVWSSYGTDSGGVSFGGDIFQSYGNRDGSHYHTTGQGINNKLFYNDLRVSYVLNPKIQLEADLGYRIRHNTNEFETTRMNFFYVALRTKLWSRYADY